MVNKPPRYKTNGRVRWFNQKNCIRSSNLLNSSYKVLLYCILTGKLDSVLINKKKKKAVFFVS